MTADREPCDKSLEDQKSHIRAQKESRYLHYGGLSKCVVLLVFDLMSTMLLAFSRLRLQGNRRVSATVLSLLIACPWAGFVWKQVKMSCGWQLAAFGKDSPLGSGITPYTSDQQHWILYE